MLDLLQILLQVSQLGWIHFVNSTFEDVDVVGKAFAHGIQAHVLDYFGCS